MASLTPSLLKTKDVHLSQGRSLYDFCHPLVQSLSLNDNIFRCVFDDNFVLDQSDSNNSGRTGVFLLSCELISNKLEIMGIRKILGFLVQG